MFNIALLGEWRIYNLFSYTAVTLVRFWHTCALHNCCKICLSSLPFRFIFWAIWCYLSHCVISHGNVEAPSDVSPFGMIFSIFSYLHAAATWSHAAAFLPVTYADCSLQPWPLLELLFGKVFWCEHCYGTNIILETWLSHFSSLSFFFFWLTGLLKMLYLLPVAWKLLLLYTISSLMVNNFWKGSLG